MSDNTTEEDWELAEMAAAFRPEALDALDRLKARMGDMKSHILALEADVDFPLEDAYQHMCTRAGRAEARVERLRAVAQATANHLTIEVHPSIVAALDALEPGDLDE